MGDVRYDRLWITWDAGRASGVRPEDLARALTTQELVMLLAANAACARPAEKAVIADALLERLKRDPSGNK